LKEQKCIRGYIVLTQKLLSDSSYTAGAGTYALDGNLYASRVGIVTISNKCIFVGSNAPTGLAVGDTITARVSKLQTTGVTVDVMTEGENTQSTAFLPAEHISSSGFDACSAYALGDIIRARIIGLSHVTTISTIDEDLGVIYTSSPQGFACRVTGWNSVVCEKTGVAFTRKCARPAANAK
jgi:exosome complex RNA-binding protein Csl4